MVRQVDLFTPDVICIVRLAVSSSRLQNKRSVNLLGTTLVCNTSKSFFFVCFMKPTSKMKLSGTYDSGKTEFF